MKILITTDWYRPVINGVVTSVLNLTEQLEKRGHEVKVLTLSRNCHSYKEENVIYAGSVGMGKIYPQARVKIPVVAGEYMEELLAWKPDLIHSQCEFSTFFLAKRIAGELDIPIIHTYHTVYEDYTHYFSPQKAWGRSLVQMMTRKLSDQVDAMIAPSGKIERILEGKNGWQYENESMYLECIQKWKEFSEDEKRRMRNTAVRTADQFSKESFAKRVERVYLAALEERKRRNVYAA